MHNISVLVVEDEENLRKLIKTYLVKEGAKVFEAADGEQAMTIFEEKKIDLVILDIMLPKYDGWSVCKMIRENSQAPIIMLTARNEENDKLFGFELGADDYITKPFSLKELIARTKALLKRTKTADELQDIIKIGNLVINKVSHQVTVDDENIDLSPKEYDLLLYFVIHKKQALTREMILDGVWGYDYYGDLRTVDTHVKRLRKKISHVGDKIVTIRGTGYRFEVE